MSTQIQIRRDTTANWESVNPVLADGEIGYDTTANKFKIGNGTDAWVKIEYSGGGGGDVDCNIPILGSPPANPELGEQWFSSTDGYLYIWYGAEWVAIGGAGSGDGGGSGGDSGSDPHWLNVRLLVNGDGVASDSQNITDASGINALTVVNSAKITTSVFKHGTGSVYVASGTKDSVTAPAGDYWHIDNSDYTVEFWVQTNGPIFNANLVSSATNNSAALTNFWIEFVSGKLVAYISDGSNFQAISDNQDWASYATGWHHIAYTNDVSSNKSRLFVDGNLKAEETTPSTNKANTKLFIGAVEGGAYPISAWFDDIRITKGVCRYAANFTPPDLLPTKQGARVVTIDYPEEPIQAGDNDADLS